MNTVYNLNLSQETNSLIVFIGNDLYLFKCPLIILEKGFWLC